MSFLKNKVFLIALLSAIVLSGCQPKGDGPAASGNINKFPSRAPSERELRIQIESSRQEKDRSLRQSPNSPLPEEERTSFKGLKYFPIDQGYRFECELNRYDGNERVKMLTTAGEPDEYIRYGYFEFKVGSAPCRLDVFLDPKQKHLFLPFRDATSGKETYGAGRYLNIEQIGESRFILDFNLAYNPYCAYNPRYSCPIAPSQNKLKAEIRAGEKNYHD